VSTWLIQATGDKGAPGFWMMFGAACGLAGTLVLYGRKAATRSPAQVRG
jgi:MFS transporter, MHS family, citrate/tricarballylate:H+ symporter